MTATNGINRIIIKKKRKKKKKSTVVKTASVSQEAKPQKTSNGGRIIKREIR